MSESSENKRSTSERSGGRLRNMALFLVSPFIGLYYAVLMPGKLLQLAKAEFQASSSSSKPTKRP